MGGQAGTGGCNLQPVRWLNTTASITWITISEKPCEGLSPFDDRSKPFARVNNIVTRFLAPWTVLFSGRFHPTFSKTFEQISIIESDWAFAPWGVVIDSNLYQSGRLVLSKSSFPGHSFLKKVHGLLIP
jgi:hypothetical protein